MYRGPGGDMKINNRVLQKLPISTTWTIGSKTEVRRNASEWPIPPALL